MPAKIDTNQPEIVAALRAAGASVTHTHMVGGGCPDLVVGYRAVTYLLEVKPLGKATRLTNAERLWFEEWRGHAAIVTTPEDALRAIGAVV
jgi:hypothetical protein